MNDFMLKIKAWQWSLVLPILLGLGILFIPMYIEMASTIWQSDDQAHAPLMIAISIYFMFQAALAFDYSNIKPVQKIGMVVFLFGLFLFVLTRSQDILSLAIFSQLFILCGIVLYFGGWPWLKVLAFPIVFLIFSAPLPGALIDAITGVLKQFISSTVEHSLYALGYPIARSGAILYVGQYQLLVADACSGLHSLFSLLAVTCIYLYIQQYKSIPRNFILLALSFPIAIVANMIRVLSLVLITYYLGDEAAQGFMHGMAGMMLFAVALVLVFIADWVLSLWFDRKQPAIKSEKNNEAK